MDTSKFAKVAGACALALTTTAIQPTVFAQENAPMSPAATQEDHDRDWGWIGLFGLLGLFGLAGRKRENHYETNRTTTTPVR